MQDQDRTIEKLLFEVAHLNESCEHRQAYQCSIEAINLAGELQADGDLFARALLAASRSAYYLSSFEECTRLVEEAAKIFDDSRLDSADPGRVRDEREIEAMFAEINLIKSNVLRRTGEYNEALKCLELLDIVPDHELPPRMIIEKLLTRGSCLYYLGDLEKAHEDLEAALGLATHNGDLKARSRVLIMLGLINRATGFMEKALDYFSRGGELSKERGDDYGEAASLLNEAIACYHLGRFNISEKKASRARSLFGRIEWELGICRSLILQGNIRRKNGDYRGALSYYGKAGSIAVENGYTRECAIVDQMKGAIAGARGDMTLASRLLTESLRSADAIAPSGDLTVDIRRRLGLVFLLSEKYDESKSYLDSALSDADRSGDSWSRGLVLRARGSLYFRMAKQKRAKKTFKKAIDILRSAGCIHELARTHMIFASELLSSVGIEVGRHDCGVAGVDLPEVGEALRNLVEAGHLFSGTEDEVLKLRADDMIERVLGLRRRSGLTRPAGKDAGETVVLEGVEDIIIGDGIAGVSEKMIDIGRKVSFAASFEKPVLITGETGTGKELIARMIHDKSGWARKPFIAVNCAAIPDHLFESEFFGHRKGCFTGATSDRRGFFEEADGGTVFLDEIAELSLLQQVKLLRVLQEKKIRRVGDNVERPADFKVICATNRDIERLVSDSKFREDLYYRINVDHIHLPPLRSRPEDVVALIIWRLCGRSEGTPESVRIEQQALRLLQSYRWPGNTRELLAVVDRIDHMNKNGIITVDMLPEKIKEASASFSGQSVKGASVMNVEVSLPEKLKRVMSICRGNKSAAARWLGISRGTLYKELRRAGLNHYIR